MATYVLVHGSWQGGWIWKPVVAKLRAAGHEVYAPTLDGCAERVTRFVRTSHWTPKARRSPTSCSTRT